MHALTNINKWDQIWRKVVPLYFQCSLSIFRVSNNRNHCSTRITANLIVHTMQVVKPPHQWTSMAFFSCSLLLDFQKSIYWDFTHSQRAMSCQCNISELEKNGHTLGLGPILTINHNFCLIKRICCSLIVSKFRYGVD